MSRETSPYIVGEYWLDKRRDGKSPEIWQIARYANKTRSIIYKSTKRRLLDEAKPIIHAYDAEQRANKYQSNDDAAVIPQLILYIRERSDIIVNIQQSKSSMRVFIGFLMQDELSVNATFSQVNKAVWQRFIKWRMNPHEYSVQWGGREYNHTSQGVSGETVSRNLDDIRAAFNYAEDQERIEAAPKVKSIDKRYRSPARDVQLSISQLSAIMGYAKQSNIGAYRWVCLMVATGVRPDAGLAFNPLEQDKGGLLDMQPKNWRRTDKGNPTVPCIEPLRPILNDWAANPHKIVKSRKTWWRQMRQILKLENDIVPKTIRHSIATMLKSKGVSGGQISGLLGHDDPEMKKVTNVYAKHDPRFMDKAKKKLTIIFNQIDSGCDKWCADHLLTKPKKGNGMRIDKIKRKP